MRYIMKEKEPASLTHARKTYLKKYSDMREDLKDEIKASLLKEQKHLCAYCMKRISSDDMQIEHYVPQHPNGNIPQEEADRLSIDYNNMLGVCNGGKSAANHSTDDLTCDQHRGNAPLTVNPLRNETIEKIAYRSNGEIYSMDQQINNDLDKTLNLNAPGSYLVKNRKEALESFQSYVERHFAGKRLTFDDWSELLTKIQNGRDGECQPFVGIIEYYINRKIRQHSIS